METKKAHVRFFFLLSIVTRWSQLYTEMTNESQNSYQTFIQKHLKIFFLSRLTHYRKRYNFFHQFFDLFPEYLFDLILIVFPFSCHLVAPQLVESSRPLECHEVVRLTQAIRSRRPPATHLRRDRVEKSTARPELSSSLTPYNLFLLYITRYLHSISLLQARQRLNKIS